MLSFFQASKQLKIHSCLVLRQYYIESHEKYTFILTSTFLSTLISLCLHSSISEASQVLNSRSNWFLTMRYICLKTKHTESQLSFRHSFYSTNRMINEIRTATNLYKEIQFALLRLNTHISRSQLCSPTDDQQKLAFKKKLP